MSAANILPVNKIIKKHAVAAIIGAIVGTILSFVFGLFGLALGIVAIWRSKKAQKLIDENLVEDKDLDRYTTIALILGWICFAIGALKTIPMIVYYF